jgi:ubiquinone/menaquinone biosynthesis C-methylase UbiE
LGKWFPTVYDTLMAPLEKRRFKTIRRDLIAQAEGRVLEIGSGSGVNFPFYEKAARVTAIEPNPTMMKRSLPKARNALVPIDTYLGKAERLPYLENTFDTVVGTLVFCTISEPQNALNEIQRVLKPGGKLLLFEHVRMNHAILSNMQDVLTPVWKHVCDGCHLNRDTLTLVRKTDFDVENVQSIYNGLFLVIESLNQK